MLIVSKRYLSVALDVSVDNITCPFIYLIISTLHKLFKEVKTVVSLYQMAEAVLFLKSVLLI